MEMAGILRAPDRERGYRPFPTSRSLSLREERPSLIQPWPPMLSFPPEV
ncbi:hypothetical protein ASZ90_016385 [hydrocarbon metagenome]|uniref:Uncharacterized protein n=1 Tax=hydrocarbon metagenome TaxID=938273 RepID=A0A0W8EXM9_9ZZZZ